MMARRRQDLDWKLLGHAIQHTKMFEALLMKRFPAKNNIGFDKVAFNLNLEIRRIFDDSIIEVNVE